MKENDLAVILPTGGTRAIRSSVGLTHKNIMTVIRDVAPALHLTKTCGSQCFAGLPQLRNLLMWMGAVYGIPQFTSPNPTNGYEIAKRVRFNHITHIALTPDSPASCALRRSPETSIAYA